MANSLIGKRFKVECVDFSYEGKGVAFVEERPVFVNGMLKGDKGVIQISYERNHQLFGELVSLDSPSPMRVEPRCKIHRQCGGCVFQCLNYEAQKEFKRDKIIEQFRKIAKMEVNPEAAIGMEDPYYYRNKIQVHFAEDDEGKIFSGFYKEGTHVILPVPECYIEDQKARRILNGLNRVLNKWKCRAYRENENFGEMRSALIKTSRHYEEAMLVLVTSKANFPNKERIFSDIKKECPEASTLVHNINDKKTNVILGRRSETIYGKGFIEDDLNGIRYKISPHSFFQVNPIMTEILYKKAIEFAKLGPNDIVLDAYSGVGTIGLSCAKECKEVIAVEIVEEAVKDASKNAKRNGITNFSPYCDDAPMFMNRLAKTRRHIDALFVDPPRKGCDEKFLKATKTLTPESIIYISCNPSTLARDVAILSSHYSLERLQPIDLFPMTFHVETVALLKRKTN